MVVAGVGAQLADALVDRAQHGLHRAPAFLEFAGDAAPHRLAVLVERLRVAQPGRQLAHDLDGLPGRHRQQVEAQVVGDVALEVGHHFARLRLFAEHAPGRLGQVAQRFLDLARAQRVADVAIALAVALGVAEVALQQTRLDLLEQREHEFKAALLAVVQQRVQLVARAALQARQQFARVALDAVLAGLGGGAGLADGVALEVGQQLGHLLAPHADLVGAHDAVDLELHLALDAFEQGALVLVHQELAGQRVFLERGQVHRAFFEVGEFVERVLAQRHLLAHEDVAFLVAGAARPGAVATGQAEEGLDHQAGQLVGADVVAQALLGVEHGLAEGRIHLRVRQAHVAEALLGHARVERAQLVLLLVDRD